MKLAFGSMGPAVRQLQEQLNQLASQQAPLAVDGIFGSLTQARVKEFQGQQGLAVDGVFGALTSAALTAALLLLGNLQPAKAAATVRPINQYVLGTPGLNHLVPHALPAIPVIAVSTFRPGDPKNAPQFTMRPPGAGRLGIFAAQKGGVDRAVILLLPALVRPTRTLICISHGFGQALAKVESLGWADPLSKDLIEYCLDKHVTRRWGAQALASHKQPAYVQIIRAKGKKELGPFADDGAFMREVLTDLAALTGDSFGFDAVEVMTFSSGIQDCNVFLSALRGHLPVDTVYNIDPAHGTAASAGPGVRRMQYLSGTTTGGTGRPGFEYMPVARWAREPRHAERKTFQPPPWELAYLHNHCLPGYTLHLGMELS